MKSILLVVLALCSFTILAQTGTSKQEKKIISVEKKIDKNGNEVIEKKVLEGEAAEKYMRENKESGNSIKISTDSNGHKKQIIISDEIEIEDSDDDDGDEDNLFLKSKGNKTYTERTVVIKKNADGTVEIKENSGEDFINQNLRIDSTEAKKPNIGVSLDDDMRILSVLKGGAAEQAGLEKNDVLTHFEGTFVEDYDHLKELLSKKKVGDKVSITYLRDRKEVKSTITLKGGNTRVYFNR